MMIFMALLVMFLAGASLGAVVCAAYYRSKLYFPNGQCRGCNALVQEKGHLTNCPLGMFDL
jgi:hypothetical protein